MRSKTKITIAILIGLALLGSVYIYWQKTMLAKNNPPILDFADKYALAVSEYDFERANTMSNKENQRSLVEDVKPAFDRVAKQISVSKLKFGRVEFEKSLIFENLDHVEVIEKMTLAQPAKDKKELYLRFEVKKVNRKYLVQHSTVEDFPLY
jgi:hypothetical protein